MQSSQKNMMQRLKTYACFLMPAMALTVLAGCAGGGTATPDLAAPEPRTGKGLAVERLKDGREGFVILESPQMDEAASRDFERAVRMLQDEEYEQAIVVLEKIIENSPGVSAPYINMAIACRHLGKLEQAEEYLKTALHMVPEHPAASNEYGLLYRKTGRFAESRAIYEKTIARFPDYYPAHKNLGILCDLYLNDTACALEHYEIYSRAMPEDNQVKLWIADLQIRLNRN